MRGDDIRRGLRLIGCARCVSITSRLAGEAVTIHGILNAGRILEAAGDDF